MLVEDEVAEAVAHKGVADGVDGLSDMRMMPDDGIDTCISKLTGQQTLIHRRHTVELHAPMQHRHNRRLGMLMAIVGDGLHELL